MGARRGAVLIYLSLLAALVLGLVSSSWNARLLSSSDFGDFKFLQSAIAVAGTGATIGLLSTCGVLLAGERRQRVRVLLLEGAQFQSLLIGLAAVLTAAVVLVSQTSWFGESIFLTLLVVALAFFSSLPLLFQEQFRAVGDYFGLFLLNALPPFFYVFFIGLCVFFEVAFNGVLCAALYFFSQGIASFVLIRRSENKWRLSWVGFLFLFRKNSKVGLNVYWATLLGTISAQVGIFSLQFLQEHDSSAVAVFSLALTITMPLTLLPSAMGTAYFSKLRSGAGFPPKVLLVSWLSILVMAVGFIVISPYFVHFLYGDRYSRVVEISGWCAVACVLHGMADVYNRYYLANRKTEFLFRVAMVVSLVATVSSVVLGTSFSALGCAWAKLLSSAFYVGFLSYCYHFRRGL